MTGSIGGSGLDLLSPQLLAILACPSDDHGPLRPGVGPQVGTLICTVCLSSYPIRDGIPVLLLDEATPGPNGLGVPAANAADS